MEPTETDCLQPAAAPTGEDAGGAEYNKLPNKDIPQPMTLFTPEKERELERLLGQIQLRHKPAFEELYRLTSANLYGLILKIVSKPDEAADVLQETYLKVWRNSDQFRADLGSAWGWLCQVARNAALDRIRKNSRQRELDTSDFDDLLNALEAVQPDLVDEADLSRCLQQIRQEMKKPLLLSYVYGMSHAELVQHLNAPLGTLKAWIRRGLMELRACMTV